MNIGIIGLGNIAATISKTIDKLGDKDVVLYACASRSKVKAEAFAKKFGFEKFYDDYHAIYTDTNVDLVYVATPHAFHYEIAAAAISAGKNVIVEKPVATDAKKLERLVALAKDKGVYLTEAFWTAFDPLVKIVKDRLDKGVYGNIISVKSSFGLPLKHVERLKNLSLAGGALMDLGVYCAFHSVFYADQTPTGVTAESTFYNTGVDLTTKAAISFDSYRADFICSFSRFYKNDVVIDTEKAVITFDSVNFPKKLKVKDKSTGKTTVEKISCITGYEYEFIAAKNHIHDGAVVAAEMPPATSMKILNVCDEIRKQIGLVYPFD